MIYTNIGKFRDVTKVFPPRIREDTGNEIVPRLDCSMMASFFSKIFCLTRKPWFSFFKKLPHTIPQLYENVFGFRWPRWKRVTT